METQVTVFLQGTAVLIAKKGCYEHIFAAGLPPLRELMDSLIEQGGTLLVCTSCIQERKITPDMLIETAKSVKAARAVMEILESDATITY